MNRTGRPHEIEPVALDLSVVLRARTEIGESPVWSQRTQELYFVDIAGQAIHAYRPSDGRQRVFALPDLVTSVSLRDRGWPPPVAPQDVRVLRSGDWRPRGPRGSRARSAGESVQRCSV